MTLSNLNDENIIIEKQWKIVFLNIYFYFLLPIYHMLILSY